MIKINQYGPILEWCYAADNRFLNLLAKPVWTSCYLIDGLLIDSCAPASVPELKSFLQSQEKDRVLEKCFLTHWHEDHAGGAGMLREVFGIPVYAHGIAIEKIKKGFTYRYYRRWAWGKAQPPADLLPPPSGDTLTTGSGRFVFDIFPLPGHAEGLLGLIEMKQGWAFVGDGVMPRYTMLFGPNSGMPEDIREIHQSLKNLLDLTRDLDQELTLFLAGFGKIDKGREFMKKRTAEIESLHARVHEQKARGLTEKRILKEVFGGESVTGRITRGHLSRMNLIQSLLAWPF
jgi:glyoxylase-like metal-dependent hydrolase (beta-lactamase superfamily II)